MVGHYMGIKAIFKMLRIKGMISNEEYSKCINELERSCEEESKKVIDETLERILKKTN